MGWNSTIEIDPWKICEAPLPPPRVFLEKRLQVVEKKRDDFSQEQKRLQVIENKGKVSGVE